MQLNGCVTKQISQGGKMKRKMVGRIVGLVGAMLVSASAYAYISEGVYTDGRNYYYVNGKGAYCTSTYNPNAQWLTRYQMRELQSQRYDGICEAYGKGPKNYQGRSYYFNGEGAYRQYAYYKRELREMDYRQAQDLFRANRFDGTCHE